MMNDHDGVKMMSQQKKSQFKKFVRTGIWWFGIGGCVHNSVDLNAEKMAPPRAERIEKKLTAGGDTRVDFYHWLNERENPRTLEYLKKENAYYDNFMAPRKALKNKLFNELKSRLNEDESSAPYPHGPYLYSSRFKPGLQYPIYLRSREGKEEILLDVNKLSKQHKFTDVSSLNVSPDHRFLAYAIDHVGRRFYSIVVLDTKDGFREVARIDEVTPYFEWANDNETIFYAAQDKKTLRADSIYRFSIRTRERAKVFEEKDETFNCVPTKTAYGKFIYVVSDSTLTTETLYVDAAKPQEPFKVFLPRQRGHEYRVADGHDGFYIMSNDHAPNFKLLKADFSWKSTKEWSTVIDHSQDVYLQDIRVFKTKVGLIERKDGLTRLSVYDKASQRTSTLEMPDAAYVVGFGPNEEYEATKLRYIYESPRVSRVTYDLSLSERTSEVVHQRTVPNYDPEKYKVNRIWITARDGVKVPVTIITHKDFVQNGTAPLLQYGYGSYGYSIDPTFSALRVSLLDRGFVYAIAHIRGGGELGRKWTDSGRTTAKMNTFNDFIDVTEALAREKWADPSRIYAMGGSAGGLLMGVITNQRPDLYRGIVAQVPFVDVLTTMLDTSIPLTTGEYDEWGNPNQKKLYNYIKSYSPYDNVKPQRYPNLMVRTGFHDSQVQYWEPAKWVAKIRENNTADTVTLFHTEFEAGHGGPTGRYEMLEEYSEVYTFLLTIDGQRPK